MVAVDTVRTGKETSLKLMRCLIAPCTLLVLGSGAPAAAEIVPVGEELPLAAGTVRSRLVAPAEPGLAGR